MDLWASKRSVCLRIANKGTSVNFVALDAEWWCIKGFTQANCSGVMESRIRATWANVQNLKCKRPQPHRNSRKYCPSSYFTVESFLVLVILAASMILLPLILPPLPPPPFLLLLLPVVILVVLMVLAFMPSNIQNIASSQL